MKSSASELGLRRWASIDFGGNVDFLLNGGKTSFHNQAVCTLRQFKRTN